MGLGDSVKIPTAYLVTDNLFLLDIVKSRHSETIFIIWVDVEIDIPQMGEVRMDGIWGYILAGNVLICFRKAPA